MPLHGGEEETGPGVLGLRNAVCLGVSLRTWRMLRRMKQNRAAELLGVSQATVSRWESGMLAPSAPQAARLRHLMTAALDGAADRALADLVRRSADEVHLVCDATHRLLAVSPRRERTWRVGASDLLGTSMWRHASAEIVEAEERLSALGWFEPDSPTIRVFTGPNASAEVPIRRGWMRWTRMRLSDGSYARLVRSAAGTG